MDKRTKDAVRFLGYGKTPMDTRTLLMIQKTFERLETISNQKYTYQIYDLLFPKRNELKICNLHIKSKSLYHNLKGCKQIVVLGATLGVEVDRLINQYEIVDITHALVAQACAAVMLEEYCDKMQEEIAQQLAQENLYLRPRFSPGYGDFSILHQKDILAMLEAPKKIGLTMTDGYMLAPTKSVTAVIGVSKTKEPCHQRGCEECTKVDCMYRRS